MLKSYQDFTREKTEVRDAVEAFLEAAFDAYDDTPVSQVARYTALGGGHRWRPIVAVAAGKIFHDDPLNIGLPAACGIELAHAASLILDDLPSMDDASLRRGKACAHLVFPKWAVDMAPIFLVNMAYEVSLGHEGASEKRRIKAALSLGKTGREMIAGQCLDMSSEASAGDKDQLIKCYALKSAALYGSAAFAGAVLCGASEFDAQRVERAGYLLGLSYQFMDDVADVTATSGEVGKDVQQDDGKFTSIDFVGVEGARQLSVEYQDKALAELETYGEEANWLRSIVREASWATH